MFNCNTLCHFWSCHLPAPGICSPQSHVSYRDAITSGHLTKISCTPSTVDRVPWVFLSCLGCSAFMNSQCVFSLYLSSFTTERGVLIALSGRFPLWKHVLLSWGNSTQLKRFTLAYKHKVNTAGFYQGPNHPGEQKSGGSQSPRVLWSNLCFLLQIFLDTMSGNEFYFSIIIQWS